MKTTFALLILCLSLLISVTCQAQSARSRKNAKEFAAQTKEAFLKSHPGVQIESESAPKTGRFAYIIIGILENRRIVYSILPDGSIAENVWMPEGFPKEGIRTFRKRHPNADIVRVSKHKSDASEGFAVHAKDGETEIRSMINRTGTAGDDMLFEPIAFEEIPAPVIETLQLKFPGKEYSNPRRVTKNKKTEYCVTMPSEDDDAKQITVYLTPEGKLDTMETRTIKQTKSE